MTQLIHRYSRPRRGMTLTELLISLTVLAILSVGATNLILAGLRIDRTLLDSDRQVSEMELAIRRMIHNIRTGSAITLNGTTGLTLTSQADATNSGQTYTVIYTYDSSAHTLSESTTQYGSTPPTNIIAYNVTAFSISQVSSPPDSHQHRHHHRRNIHRPAHAADVSDIEPEFVSTKAAQAAERRMTNAWKIQRARHGGTAMALAILLSVVLTGIVACLALAATIQSNTTSALIKTDGTFYAAEYAMQDTFWRYKNDNAYRAASSSPRTMTLTMGSYTYNCSITCQDSVGFPTIEWKFDEGSGATTADSSGNGNTGALTNCTWNNGARQGPNCLYFDGATSYVDAGSSQSTNIAGDVTMAAWIKLTNASFDQKIGGDQNGAYGGYKFYIYNSKVVFEVRDASNNSTRNKNQPGGTVLAVNTWYHVAGLYSETNHWIKTYVNGQEEVSRRMTGLPAHALGTTSPLFIIGREPFDALYYFGGLIDDVRVYASEQSDASILAMYNSAVEVHASATLSGTKNTASAAVTASIPLPPPPTLPELVVKNALTLKNCTISGDVQVDSDLTGSGSASTIDGNITYAGVYTPAGKITQVNTSTETLTHGTVTVPTVNTASVIAQAQQTYSSSQNGTTFTFTPLSGNKVIYVNGDVTDPKFDLSSGVFPSGGTLMINGKLILTADCTIGNATNAVYVICTGDCNQNNTAKLTVYGGLYVGGNWNRRDAFMNGPVVVQASINDAAGNASTFSTGSVPWFDPRVISYNGAAAMPMVFSSYHDDNN